MVQALSELCTEWRSWAANADRSENGWQSDFPRWQSLMDAAKAVMREPAIRKTDLEDLEFCWAISEETEGLADYAKENSEACWQNLCRLAASLRSEVRWQVYEALGFAGPRAEDLLIGGLGDPDPYCQRRAILALTRLRPKDGRELARPFLSHKDPYIRKSAIELSESSPE